MPIMRDIVIRNATNKDKEQLEQLFEECFGDMAKKSGALSWIKGRYVVAELHTNCTAESVGIKPRIVAVSGILKPEHSEFQGYEITWTCTTEEYRKKGLIVNILKKCISELPDDGIPLYCDCWRIKENKSINLSSVMKHLGMHEVINERIKRKHSHSVDCIGCPNEAIGCYCCGDLYIKER